MNPNSNIVLCYYRKNYFYLKKDQFAGKSGSLFPINLKRINPAVN